MAHRTINGRRCLHSPSPAYDHTNTYSPISPARNNGSTSGCPLQPATDQESDHSSSDALIPHAGETRPTDDHRPPLPAYNETLNNVSSLPDFSSSASYELPGNGQRGTNQLPMDAGINRASRAMWHIINALEIQGHTRNDRPLMQHMQGVAPPVSNNRRIL